MTKKQLQEIQELQKKPKARRETGLFVVEGERLVSEVPEALLHAIYVTEEYAAAHRERTLVQRAEVVPPHVLSKLSDTKTPQGILAVAAVPSFERDALLSQPDRLFLILETIQDPGNLGTIFRTAEGAGVTAIFLNRETADLYAPKSVRSTMGSIFREPHFVVDSVAEAVSTLKAQGVTCAAAQLDGSVRYDKADYTGATAFLIGNEGNGLSKEASALADVRVHIPMKGKLESLNAGVATALLLYEAARQRGFS